MIKEAENIILTKQYYELSADELATVSELVANAEEFEDMKWFLASTQQALVSEKIEASPDLKKKVMAHLNQPADKRRFWLNGVIPFLLPEDKKFYQKPAFQMSIAAVLIIGFIMINNNSFKDSTVALNDGKMIEDKVGGEKSGEMIPEESEEVSSTLVLEEPVPADDFGGAELANTRVVEDAVVYEVVEEEEIDEIGHDGYYSGPLTDDDLKKIEQSKDKDLNNLSTNGNNFGNNTGKVERTVTPAIVDVDDETVVTKDNNYSENVPGQSSGAKDQSDFKGKKKADKKDGKDRRLKKTNADAYSSNSEVANKPDIEQNLAGGYYDKNRDDSKLKSESDDADVILEEDKEKEYKEIRPFSAHVNETKELKKLFTVYK